MPILKADHVSKVYHDGTRELEILRDVSLSLNAGETLAILGVSGSGKSTLLHILGALDDATTGSVEIDSKRVSTMNRAATAELRLTKVGFVFQAHHLIGELSALDNVVIPLLAGRMNRSAARERATELLTEVGLAERLAHRPAKLSGGEQQRVAIARALANRPSLLLADEPTGNLDEDTGEAVADLLFDKGLSSNAASESGRSLVLVTHDQRLAKRADRCLFLHEGVLEPWEPKQSPLPESEPAAV